jgi:DNA-binding NtrC family response regulator
VSKRRAADGTETLHQDGARVARAPVGALVRILDAPATPAEFRLAVGRCRIGSAAGCDIVLKAPTVSRAHVELELVPEGVVINDLGSRNGTFYMGQRIERAVLSLGARIKVGAASVAIEPDTETLELGGDFKDDEYRGVSGVSPAMHRLFGLLQRLEGSLTTVLIEGESGVGKELIARAIHAGSPVGAGPLIALNCGAIARELIASELFGHKKGAFTGAADSRRGAFELADSGTLFLDEIGELPLDVQPMLLRALESGEIRALGSERAKSVHVRIVAATNRALGDEVGAGRFREDLFYRLAVVRIRVPPLRERPEDIAPLAQRFAREAGCADMPPEVIERLRARAWPGNVRELRNAIQAFVALGMLPEAAPLRSSQLDGALRSFVDLNRPYAEQKDELADRFTRFYLESLLAETGGNQTAAAELAGLDRTYLGRLTARLAIDKKRR